VSDDRSQLDRERVWRWLSEQSYWAAGRSLEVVERSIEASVCLGLYEPGGAQAGFCRWVTDAVTFAWLADVFVDEHHRGRGVGAWLVGCALEHPSVTHVGRQLLATRDAHGLYEGAGFARLDADDAARFMVRRPPGAWAPVGAGRPAPAPRWP